MPPDEEVVPRLSQPKAFLLRLLTQPTNHTGIQLFRYTLVGGLAYLCDFGTLFALTEGAGWHYLLSAAIGFLLGLTVNYLLSILWVFRTHTLDQRSLEVGIYAGVGVAGLALNELTLWVFTDGLGLHYLVSKFVATGFVFLWNFTMRKYLLFR